MGLVVAGLLGSASPQTHHIQLRCWMAGQRRTDSLETVLPVIGELKAEETETGLRLTFLRPEADLRGSYPKKMKVPMVRSLAVDWLERGARNVVVL